MGNTEESQKYPKLHDIIFGRPIDEAEIRGHYFLDKNI